MLNERIQIEVLGRLANNPYGGVLRREIAELFGVSGVRVDFVMSRCALVKRAGVGGAQVHYRLV